MREIMVKYGKNWKNVYRSNGINSLCQALLSLDVSDQSDTVRISIIRLRYWNYIQILDDAHGAIHPSDEILAHGRRHRWRNVGRKFIHDEYRCRSSVTWSP